MMTEISQKSSVQKLKGLLLDRYGLGLKFSTLVSIADLGAGTESTELRGGSLHVPVYARGKYLATALLTGADRLSDGDISAVAAMVRLVLEPALFSLYLDRQESNNHAWIEARRKAGTTNLRSLSSPDLITPLILLESHNPHSISKVAIHVHETQERWALLRLSDVADALKSKDELRDLGPLTILIDDLLCLSPAEQKTLTDFAVEAKSKTEPMILLGCTRPFQELIHENLVYPPLAELLKSTCLEIDRMPQDFSRLRETIEIAMDFK